MANKKTKTKTGNRQGVKSNFKKIALKSAIYGLNTVVPRFGNPDAIIYAGLDIASHYSDRVRNSPYPRLIKAVGALGSALCVWKDLYWAFEFPELLAHLPFDASLAYQLGKDSLRDYSVSRIKSDFGKIKRDIGKLVGKTSELIEEQKSGTDDKINAQKAEPYVSPWDLK